MSASWWEDTEEEVAIQVAVTSSYLALWCRPSVPWRPGRRSVPGRTPGPAASDGTWQRALPAVGRCLRRGWEQMLEGRNEDVKRWKSMTSAAVPG